MFSFGLFSTHLPFILIGLVSFISMGYAHFHKLEKQINEVVEISFEEKTPSHHSNAGFYGFKDNQESSGAFIEDSTLQAFFAVSVHLSPHEGIPLLKDDLIFPFFARPPPVNS